MKLYRRNRKNYNNYKIRLAKIHLFFEKLILSDKLKMDKAAGGYFVDIDDSFFTIPVQSRDQIYSQAVSFQSQIGDTNADANWVQCKKLFVQIFKAYNLYEKRLYNFHSVMSADDLVVTEFNKKKLRRDTTAAYVYKFNNFEFEVIHLLKLVRKYKNKLKSSTSIKPGKVSRIRTFLRYFLVTELLKQLSRRVSDSVVFSDREKSILDI